MGLGTFESLFSSTLVLGAGGSLPHALSDGLTLSFYDSVCALIWNIDMPFLSLVNTSICTKQKASLSRMISELDRMSDADPNCLYLIFFGISVFRLVAGAKERQLCLPATACPSALEEGKETTKEDVSSPFRTGVAGWSLSGGLK